MAMSIANYIEAYIGIAVSMFYGTAYFYPKTFQKYDNRRYPSWSLVCFIWPVSLVICMLSLLNGLSEQLMNAGLKRIERKEAITRKRVDVSEVDHDLVKVANEEVEECLREKSQ
jgi:uncharacterized membrane protein